jgi:tripartite-type tricarboxylate transporter receptor subunit TctC
VKHGQVHALAQAALARTALAPDIPTFREQGFELTGGVVRGLAAPAGTPTARRTRLEAALLATMDDPAWQAEAAQLYQPLRRMDGTGFTRLVEEEAERLRLLWQYQPWKD